MTAEYAWLAPYSPLLLSMLAFLGFVKRVWHRESDGRTRLSAAATVLMAFGVVGIIGSGWIIYEGRQEVLKRNDHARDLSDRIDKLLFQNTSLKVANEEALALQKSSERERIAREIELSGRIENLIGQNLELQEANERSAAQQAGLLEQNTELFGLVQSMSSKIQEQGEQVAQLQAENRRLSEQGDRIARDTKRAAEAAQETERIAREQADHEERCRFMSMAAGRDNDWLKYIGC